MYENYSHNKISGGGRTDQAVNEMGKKIAMGTEMNW